MKQFNKLMWILFIILPVAGVAEEPCSKEISSEHKVQELLQLTIESLKDENEYYCFLRTECLKFKLTSDKWSLNNINFDKAMNSELEECRHQQESLKEDKDKSNCSWLSSLEYRAVKDYTTETFQCLNFYLRNKKNKNQFIDEYVKLVDDALNKLPRYQGIVVRGADFNIQMAEDHKKGNVVVYDAFTSASTGMGFPSNSFFIINSLSGRPVMGISTSPNESEVLFKSGTRFEVIDSFIEKDKKIYVMGEISEGRLTDDEKKSILSKVDAMKSKTPIKKMFSKSLPDHWSCSGNKEEATKVILQKNLPSYRAMFQKE